MEQNENTTNSNICKTQTEDSINKLFIKKLIIDDEQKKEKGKAEQNLMFETKKISVFRLYCHISGKFEIFLMIAATIFTIGAGISGPILSFLIGDGLDDFTSTSEIEELSDEEFKFILDQVKPFINKTIKKFLIVGAIMFVCNFFMVFLWDYSSLRQMLWMKINYFNLILRQEQGWFDENNIYEFATKVQAQLDQIEMGVGARFGQLILLVSNLISGFVVGFISSWKLSLVLLCCFPFIIIGFLIILLCMNKEILLSRRTYEKAGGIAEEILYNIKTVTSFVNFDFELNRFGNLIDYVDNYNRKKALFSAISLGLMTFGLYFGFAFTLFYARLLIANKKTNSNTGKPFTVGDAIKVIYCIISSIFSLGSIAPNIQIIKESCIASSDYFTLYERVPKIFVSERNIKPNRETIKGKIEFKNIKFVYPNDITQRPILNNLNLTIEPGKKVAFVGESGCGKSTSVNLIERLYDPVEGQILLDGIDIKDYNLEYLRSLIGYVQQEPILFNESIKDNLIFGRENEIKKIGDPDELIKNACEDVYIRSFIEKNKDKYNYVVGVKGSKLSGGQKQRIAIARAILAHPKILILDEATSALDNQSEKEVQRALDNISKKNITTIIIAHRLSTIKNADMIFALKEGKIIEQGTHKELLDKNGYYAKLIKSQITQEELERKEENFLSKLSMKKTSSIRRLSTRYSLTSELDLNNKMEEEEKIEIDKKQLFEMISDRKCDLFLGLFGAFFYGVGSPVTGLIMGYTINALSNKDPDKVKKKGLVWSLIHLVLAFGAGLLIIFKNWKLEALGSIMTSRMRKRIFQKYLELHMGYYDIDSNSPGALLTKLSIDTTQISTFFLGIFGGLIGATGAIISSLILGFIYDWKLTLIIYCFIPFIVLRNILRGGYNKNGRQSNKLLKIEAGSFLSECVINTKTIFSYNYPPYALSVYRNILEREQKDFLKDSIMNGLIFGAGVFIEYACYCAIYRASYNFIRNKTLTYNRMNIAMNLLMTSRYGIGDNLLGVNDYPKAKLSFISLYKIMNTPSEINAFEYANEGKQFPKVFKGKIEFKNVTFAYPTKPHQNVLKNLSLIINPGENAALVGFSGCGKSSIIQLIERFYDVKNGEILIDDINIKDYNLFELRKKIGLVNQEPILFKRSIYDNILYGRLNASKYEINDAIRKAAIEKFINNNNEIDTKENPVSGGEKQRLAIARVFLKNPDILLLDEATSALDKDTEKEVQNKIDELQKGRTTISIAHRLNTIVNSDIIYVLDSGQIIEKGTHKELLAKKGKYYALYNYSNF